MVEEFPRWTRSPDCAGADQPVQYPDQDFTSPFGYPQYADHDPGDDELTPRTDFGAGSFVGPHRSWFDTGSDERVGWGAGFVYPPVRAGSR